MNLRGLHAWPVAGWECLGKVGEGLKPSKGGVVAWEVCKNLRSGHALKELSEEGVTTLRKRCF